MNSARPGERSAMPSVSKRSCRDVMSRGRTRSDSASAAIPTGMLMKKIQRHETSSTSQPPRIGPTIGPSSIGTPMMLITRPTRCGPAARVRIVIPAGMSMPPPRPWRTRKAISDSADHARPERIEPHRNRPSDSMYRRFVPKRSAAQPVIGITVASASVYPVTIHWIVSSDVSNVVVRWLIATLTTVVSRIDMIAPRTTTIATLSSARSRPLSGAAGSVAVAVCDGMSKSVAKSGGASSTCLVRLAEVPSDPARAERPLRRDAELNRQRILTAAADAFAEGGLAVTMDEIARRAGVGVGTVYRRFPDKELLVEALFEQRIDEFVALAEAARDEPDPFAGLVRFFETFLTVQAADRALKEVVLAPPRGAGRAARARDRIGPIVDDLLARALAAGAVRPDVAASDLALIQFMLGAGLAFTHDVAPETWRRVLAIVLDGLRPQREATSALPAPALADRELERAMDAWRTPVRRRPPPHESPAQAPA